MTGAFARRRGRKVRCATAALTTLALALAGTASAQAGTASAHASSKAEAGTVHRASLSAWTRQHTPNPLAPTASLAGVSCPSATTCIAVG